MAARLTDYHHDGVAAGVIFHGSTNLEPIPFVSTPLGKPGPPPGRELGVGQTIYNRWLVDFVSQSPQRHVGLALLPLRDWTGRSPSFAGLRKPACGASISGHA